MTLAASNNEKEGSYGPQNKKSGSDCEDHMERSKAPESSLVLGSYLRHIWSYFLLSAIERMDYGFSKL